jgi:hypothetical protein
MEAPDLRRRTRGTGAVQNSAMTVITTFFLRFGVKWLESADI